ncbi:MAG TPA: hypothetical protein VGR12_02505 [Solirubrobacteraceae bacterium]|nr:hypothetical protein [Solirubrobacteraceae bacterium]
MTEHRQDDDETVREEEAAAAAAAGRIGGTAGDEEDFDPAMRPVYEAGGGVAEGFEQAEADLVDNAQHGDGRGDPLTDAFRPEVESDRSGAAYGEGDEEKVTEVVRDPDDPRGGDDPGAGPKLTSER